MIVWYTDICIVRAEEFMAGTRKAYWIHADFAESRKAIRSWWSARERIMASIPSPAFVAAPIDNGKLENLLGKLGARKISTRWTGKKQVSNIWQLKGDEHHGVHWVGVH